MPATKSDLVDLDVLIVDDSRDASIRVMLADGDGQSVWLPRSEIEIEMTAPSRATITLPQWLAENRKIV